MTCLLCLSIDHTFKDCNSRDRECINCDGNHATMSKSYPKLKEAIYVSVSAEAAQNAISENRYAFRPERSFSDSLRGSLSREDMFRGFMCLVMACNIESTYPGSFKENMSKILEANGLPSFCTVDLVPCISCVSSKEASGFIPPSCSPSKIPPGASENIPT